MQKTPPPSLRAREAAEKETQRGTSTARIKWGQGEIEKFKEALGKFSPGSNIKLAAAVGTRSATQVNMFKCQGLSNLVESHYHIQMTYVC